MFCKCSCCWTAFKITHLHKQTNTFVLHNVQMILCITNTNLCKTGQSHLLIYLSLTVIIIIINITAVTVMYKQGPWLSLGRSSYSDSRRVNHRPDLSLIASSSVLPQQFPMNYTHKKDRHNLFDLYKHQTKIKNRSISEWMQIKLYR